MREKMIKFLDNQNGDHSISKIIVNTIQINRDKLSTLNLWSRLISRTQLKPLYTYLGDV